MKRNILFIAIALVATSPGYTQQQTGGLETVVSKLDKARTVKDFQALSGEFVQLGEKSSGQWLPLYYAAFCNAKIGWLKMDDPDNIEQYAIKGMEQAKKATQLLDSSSQKKELSDCYVVLSMLNRAMVYINPQTYGMKYGVPAGRFTQMARNTDPENPRALYIEGWEKYATPKLYGGDPARAKQLLRSSLQKLNSPVSGVQPHWGKTEVEELLKKIK